MKAYYINKARSPADLPEWLFDERERGLRGYNDPAPPTDTRRSADTSRPTARSGGGRRDRERDHEHEYAEALPPARPSRGPTLADGQAGSDPSTSTSTSSGARRDRSRGRWGSDDEQPVSKATSRLRELRDMKRSATRRDMDDYDSEDHTRATARSAPPPLPAAMEPARGPIGIPSRPGARGVGAQVAPLGASVGVRGRQPMGLPSGVRGRA